MTWVLAAWIPNLILIQYLAVTEISLPLLIKSHELLKTVLIYYLAVSLLSILIHVFLKRTKLLAIRIWWLGVVSPWLLISIGLVFKQTTFWIAISALMVLAYLIASSYYWWNEYSRSFIKPARAWYQGLPWLIPSLECRVQEGIFKVSRMDREGVYLFSKESLKVALNTQQAQELVFSLGGNHSIKLKGRVLHRASDFYGYGVKFLFDSMDEQKDLGDFIERLKGLGYE